jgi:hypothetical protein
MKTAKIKEFFSANQLKYAEKNPFKKIFMTCKITSFRNKNIIDIGAQIYEI